MPLTTRFLACVTVGLTLTISDYRLAEAAPSGGSSPNIMIVIADDMGYSDLGCHGGEIETPNLDGLAAGGLRFTHFYNTARCWPTRHCIISGYYYEQVMGQVKGRFKPLPHYLAPLGYRNYHSGKWHLREVGLAVRDGHFDRSYMVMDQDRFFSPRRTSLDDKPLPPVERDSGYYATTVIADYAVEFLADHARDHADKPFFMYLAFTCPHFPLHALQEDIDRYRERYRVGWDVIRRDRFKRMQEAGIIDCKLSDREPETIPHWNFEPDKLFSEIGPGEAPAAVAWDELTDEQKSFQAEKMAIHAAMVDRMDREIGRVLAQLKAMDAFDNTVIFFLSDNGASAEQIIRGDMHDKSAPAGSADSYLCLGPGWSTAANTPFRRHKSWTHEGGIATPMIAHWPEGISARGELRTDPGHVIDFLPTAVELAGGNVSKLPAVDGAPPMPGKSLVPAFTTNGAIVRDYIYFNHIENRALRMGNWKLVSPRDREAWELYDLSADRSETADLSEKHPTRVQRMEAVWRKADSEFASGQQNR